MGCASDREMGPGCSRPAARIGQDDRWSEGGCTSCRRWTAHLEAGAPSAPTGRTTATGQWAWCSSAWLTEPSSSPANPPRPRDPTTTSCARPRLLHQRAGRAVPDHQPPHRHVRVLRRPAGQPLGQHLALVGLRRRPSPAAGPSSGSTSTSRHTCTATSGTPLAATPPRRRTPTAASLIGEPSMPTTTGSGRGTASVRLGPPHDHHRAGRMRGQLHGHGADQQPGEATQARGRRARPARRGPTRPAGRAPGSR